MLQRFAQAATGVAVMQQAVAAEDDEPHEGGDRRATRVGADEQRRIDEHEEADRQRIEHTVGGHQESVGHELRRIAIAVMRDHRQDVDEDEHGGGGRRKQHEGAGDAGHRRQRRRQQDQRAGDDDRARRHLRLRDGAELAQRRRIGFLADLEQVASRRIQQ